VKKLMPAALCLTLGLSLGLFSARSQVIISEFVASNGSTLADEDGDYSDWIELYNPGATGVNLDGWYLTDSPSRLTKWRLPAVTIDPKGFLIVFASGKQRAVPGAPLHANFSLNAAGEYLALILPDGTTIASGFAPQFPEQFRDVSYGPGQLVSTNVLVPTGATAWVQIPADDALGTTWIQPGFDHSAWTSGPTGVGYETEVAGFAVSNTKASTVVDSLAAADAVLANPAQHVSVVSENADRINYFGTGSDGHYGGNSPFPGQAGGVDVEDFVVEITATVTLPAAGAWTFGVNSDDGFRLTVGSFQISYPNPRGPGDTLGVFNVPAPGDYPLRLVFYERGGGSEVELFAAPGNRTAWNSTDFRLVGDTAAGGLAVRSTPVAGGGGGSLRALIATDLEMAMKSRNASAYVRIPFALDNPLALESLTLRLQYNDGFVAFLNGNEVARRNSPEMPAWDATATADRPAALSLVFEDFNLSAHLDRLVAGINVLAIHGLNRSAADPTFLLRPELVEHRVVPAAPCYFVRPTPGGLNGEGVLGFAAVPRFSVTRGFHDAPFDVELTSVTPGAAIRYTTNGTPPTPDTGLVYQAPIRVAGTTTLRAVAVAEQHEPSPVATHTYLFVDDVVRQSPTGAAPPGWPSNWGANTVDYGMDPDIVNHPTYAPTLRDDLKAIPTFSLVMDLADLFDPATGIYANPGQDGRAWERPCSLELLNPDGTEGFQVNAGARIRGGFSRSTDNPKHAFRLFFRQEYGAAKLEYPLFGEAGTDTFDNIDLRTFQNYSWSYQGDSRGIFVRDQFSRDLQLAMGHQGERGEFYHLYLNGQYWGLFNTCERPEASYAETYYGGNADDYDVLKVEAGPYTVGATDGTLEAWTRLYQLAQAGFASDAAFEFVQGNNPDGSRNPAFENLIDVPNLIDYMLVILYGGNLDAPISNFLSNERPNNFFAIRNREGPDGFRFFVHDAEHTLLNVNENRMGPFTAGNSSVVYSNPQWVWQKLQANAEFRLRVADHVHRHFFNQGLLTPGRARELFLHRINQIDRAVVGESARWGDAQRTTPFTRADWLSAVNTVLNTHLPQRSAVVLNQLRTGGLYPGVVAPAFSQHGGNVNPGFALAMTAPAGTIYYTIDGSDPRLRGGAVSPRAIAYAGPLVMNETAEVKARVLSGNTWSALNAADFTLIQTFTSLFITEIMYHPPEVEDAPDDTLEFIELKNVGSEELDLSGVRFDSGVGFTFPIGARLAPGAFAVLVRDPDAFARHYPGVPIDGVFTGQLANSGERLTLAHAVGTPIVSVRYGDAEPWPVGADGAGFSLVPRDPNLNESPDDPSWWRASSAPGGSPGRDDPPLDIPTVVVSEVLSHTDPPSQDAVELHNPNAFPVGVGHWWLTDQRTYPKKFRIPAAAVIPANGYLVFDESDFNPTPGEPPAFALSALGDEIYLYSGDAQGNLTGYSHGFAFGAAANGVSFGRHILSTGEAQYPAQTGSSLGDPNTGPRIGPVVIAEIHHRPRAGDAEFVELQNVTANPVPLYDPDRPANTWRLNGISFAFPPGTELAPNGLLLVVSGDPAVFRTRHRVPSAVPIFGPFPGTLQDDGERIQLLRPDAPVTDDVGQPILPEIVIDEVDYRSRAPWPTVAPDSGASLERFVLAGYGNDPIHWRASPGSPSPGLENTGNRPPRIQLGANQALTATSFPVLVQLEATVTDDNLPLPPAGLAVAWTLVSGPTPAWFESPLAPHTAVSLPGVGTYVLRLTATDGALDATAETLVTVQRTTVPLTLVPQKSTWRYWDRGTELGAAWTALTYNDAAWSSGAAELGYGDGDETTTVSYGPNIFSRYITTYFRRAFPMSNPGSVATLKVGLRRDDGGVVYLNGTEVFRSNMPEGNISSTTRASSAVSGADETTFFERAVDPALLRAGTNLLAVSIHKSSPSFLNNDLSFDLYLTGTGYPANASPQANAGPDQAVLLPAPASIEGQVADDGLPIPPGQLAVTWSVVSGPGPVTFTPINAPRTSAHFDLPGSYVLQLTASDGSLAASDELAVTVTADTYAEWKRQHFNPLECLDPAVSGDLADPDADGLTNRAEFDAGTDPRDPRSRLEIIAIAAPTSDPPEIQIQFKAVAGRTYTLQSAAATPVGPWQDLVSIPAAAETGIGSVAAPLPETPVPQFYRVKTP